MLRRDPLRRTSDCLIYVYSGEGACQRAMRSTVESLRSSTTAKVYQLNRLDLRKGNWREECTLLVLPGGAGKPYCQFLDGVSNELIKDYVRRGGAFLGICEGAEHTCSRTDAAVNQDQRGTRQLRFFPGIGRGAVQAGAGRSSDGHPAALTLAFKANGAWQHCVDYSNGGPAFVQDEDPGEASIEVIARYINPVREGSAAVRCLIGNGVVVLCGTHPELGHHWLDKFCRLDHMKRIHPCKSLLELAELVLQMSDVQSKLLANQQHREQFWKSLLVSAGLEGHVL